ncbi:MAG: hypothetical protein KAJ73_00355 [Zetaproteobacteria bacterium]|nr:hypothetical protein [Zetaproteobacteria bacterium]
MPAANKPLIIEQGATYRKQFTWKGPAPDKIPHDLTDYVARMHVRKNVKSNDILLDLTNVNGGIILGGDAGTIVLYISATGTKTLDWERAVYDLELEDTSGEVYRLLKGEVTVDLQVTRE